MKSYLSEFIGTFLFVFFLTCAFVWSGGSILWTGTAAGIGIALSVALFSRVSGAHCNPAVSLAAFFGGSLSGYLLLPYWIAQFAGAIAAAFAASFLFPADQRLGAVLFAADPVIVVLMEGVVVFFLSLLHLIAVERWRRFVPLLVGVAVCVSLLLLLPFTGAGLNPARVIAPVVIAAFPPAAVQVWILVLAAFLGGAGAGLVLRRYR